MLKFFFSRFLKSVNELMPLKKSREGKLPAEITVTSSREKNCAKRRKITSPEMFINIK